MPILTPRYFQSAECRRELRAFADLATDLGVKDLILPLLYLEFPEITEKNPKDELIQLVNTFQREDWREIRFLAVDSEGYRRGVARLADKLVRANKKAEEVIATIDKVETSIGTVEHENFDDKVEAGIITVEPENIVESENPDEEPGLIDLLADFEEKLEQAPTTLVHIGEEVNKIGAFMRQATADITQDVPPNLVFKNRLIVTKRLTHQLSEPVEQIWMLSNDLSSQLHSIDKGYRILIEQAPIEIEKEPASVKSFCNLFASVRAMSASSDEALQSVQVMIDATTTLDKMSRDLRPLMRRLRQGLTMMMEMKELTQEWLKLIDTTNIKCSDTNT